MNTLPNSPTAADLLTAALADLERAASQVIQHNSVQMQHPRMRAWLTGNGREPDNGSSGIVSALPYAQIVARMRRGEAVTIGEVSEATARLQRNLARKQKRIADRAAERDERRAA
ncbi:protein of unknown function [Thauera humireducens]|uniref:hypothetical protein n=1 Tax=Thauera humireducens TaxID=1134435 RepID=UPI002467A5CF|nr:hypothetical protein [Thauera humireducens]CAH1745635.1 protein of unknown function [Thauera humireducens]